MLLSLILITLGHCRDQPAAQRLKPKCFRVASKKIKDRVRIP
jgi:hypothetical protein